MSLEINMWRGLLILLLNMIVVLRPASTSEPSASRPGRGSPENSGTVFPTNVIQDLLKGAPRANRPPASALILLCGPGGGDLAVVLARSGVPTTVVDRSSEWVAALLRAMDDAEGAGHLNVLLDVACPDATQLLAEANERNLFTTPRRWLLFNLEPSGALLDYNTTAMVVSDPRYRLAGDVPRGEYLESCYSNTADLFHGLTVLLDTDVTALCRQAPGSLDVVALSVYRIWMGSPLRLGLEAQWLGGVVQDIDQRPVIGRRLDMDGYVVNVGFVVFNKADLQRAVKEGDVTADYLTTYFWELTHNMVEMLNGTINVTLTNTWGYVKTGIPTEGLFGMQIKGEIEVGGSGYSQIIDPLRFKYLTFTSFYCPLRGLIVLRSPPLSYENNVFTLPFPPTLWAASLGAMVLCSILLTIVMHAEEALGVVQESPVQALHSGSDAVLLTVGAVCQQGSPVEARGIPGRTITLMLFVLVLLLYTCYSASIVVLLQSTSSSISHFRDLLTSQIKMGVSKVPYALHYMTLETDPLRQRVLREKIMDKKGKPKLFNEAEGIAKVRSEYFAYIGLEGMVYKQISSTWREEEKCGLVFLPDFIRVKDPHIAITKASHNAKAFTIMLRKLQERGLRHRVYNKFFMAKPMCSNSAAVFHSVSLTDCRGAFQVLATLSATSLVVLLAEFLVHRRQKKQGAEKTVEGWKSRGVVARLTGKVLTFKL